MAVAHDTVTVGTTAVAINLTEASGNRPGQSVLVSAAGDVFIGGPGVTTADYGFKVADGAPLAADLSGGDVLYAIAAADVEVHVLYLGV